MFLEFYHLRQQPFGVTPDPAYLYLTRTHRDALSSLITGIDEGRGFLALVAEPGMGKTTLMYQLLDELRDLARTVFLFQTQCDSREFLQYLLSELNVDTKGMDIVSMHGKLKEVLLAEMIAGRRFVLVVDEAQNLDDSVLETVRLLSNFETSYAKMLQIVLVGQPQLFDKLARPQLAQLRQRVAVLARLEPLTAAETANYIEHRLEIAGYSGAPLFTPPAAALVGQLSQGVPRNINHLCHTALGAAHAQGLESVGADIVQDVAVKLDTGSAGLLAPESVATTEAAAKWAKLEVENSVQEPRLGLTSEPVKQSRLPRWAFRAFVLIGFLLAAGISLTAFVLRLTESDKAGRTASAQIVPHQPKTGLNYSADPQERGSVQLITVAAEPRQTLRDISLLYIGRFDDKLLKEIGALNPELKDPYHPKAGQLIRLPLPAGSFRKGKVFTPEE